MSAYFADWENELAPNLSDFTCSPQLLALIEAPVCPTKFSMLSKIMVVSFRPEPDVPSQD